MKLLSLLSALILGLDGFSSVSPGIERFLSETFRLSQTELMDLRNGRAIVRSLPSTDDREITSVGVIRVQVAPADYIDQLRDITVFKRSEMVPQIGTFGAQPTVQDVERLTLPDDDRRDLARCRRGECDVQLPAEAMERIARAVEWNSPQEAEQVNHAFRAEIVRIASSYLELGEGGMPVYHDRPVTTSMAVEFRSMVWDEPTLLRRFDSLSEHFRRFPRRTAGVEDVLYWSREKVGRTDVISITHLAIQALADREPVAFIAASRQVYSTHYFDASLGITLLLSDPALPGSTVVVYANRSRVDVFGGLLGAMKRSIAASRSRAAIKEVLTAMQKRVEQRAAPGSRNAHPTTKEKRHVEGHRADWEVDCLWQQRRATGESS